ncbi:MAG TPA: ABC transporter substrate-binding protein [Intrasporangiaceae bacterium]|nr:ABC transporter substrate-binding protein [Intrasporangiaceae bacterium]
MRALRFVPVLVGGLLLAGCGTATSSTDSGATAPSATTAPAEAAATSVTVTDSQGREVEVPTNPETVVAMDWSVIRTLSDLGVEVDAVPQAVGQLPDDLAAYADATTVGTVFEPDYEAIAALDPDVVIVGSRSGTPEVVAEFEKFAPAVLDMSVRAEDPADVFDVTTERVVQLGSIFGLEQEATDLMNGLESQIAEVKSQAADAGTAMVVQVSDGTLSAYGPGSRFSQVYTDFGFAATQAPIEDGGSHGEEISQEFFVQYNPGVLFVLDRAKAIGEEQTPALDVLNNGLVGTTDAAKNGTITEIDGFAWYLAASAPSSWQQMVDDVREAL